MNYKSMTSPPDSGLQSATLSCRAKRPWTRNHRSLN